MLAALQIGSQSEFKLATEHALNSSFQNYSEEVKGRDASTFGLNYKQGLWSLTNKGTARLKRPAATGGQRSVQ